MNLREALLTLPGHGAVVILSGGMDSTIAMRLAVEKYKAENVKALSFYYGQKQAYELICAQTSTRNLGVKHQVVSLEWMKYLCEGFSANIDANMVMPTIQEVLGDPTPKTYVPYRNLILLSIATCYAEVNKVNTIITGLQATDQYNYWDTTPKFVKSLNELVRQNRTFQPTIIAPFSCLTKTEELRIIKELDGNFDLLTDTLTCYNPTNLGQSCGNCPSCSERLKAFKNIGEEDVIDYV